MPLLKPDLLSIYNDPSKFTFYYGGGGNFTQNKLKYSKDQPGGQWSGEPYVQWPLPDFASPSTLEYYSSNRSSLDFPLRGGGLNYDINSGIFKSAAAGYDQIRISKFLKSSPKGTIFIAKQIGLQLSNPKLEVGTQANLSPGQTTARSFGEIENTRIYNGGRNTLVQVGYQGSGVHVDRHGITPFNPYNQTYEKVVESYNTAKNGEGNRLVTLLTSKIYGKRSDGTGDLRNNTNRLGISYSQPLLFQYIGGPGSTYGIGLTTIRRYYNGNNLYIRTTPFQLYKKPQAQSPSNSQPNGEQPAEATLVSLQELQAQPTAELVKTDTNILDTVSKSGYVQIGSKELNTEARNRLTFLQQRLFGVRSLEEEATVVKGSGYTVEGFLGSNDLKFQQQQALGLVEGKGSTKVLDTVVVSAKKPTGKMPENSTFLYSYKLNGEGPDTTIWRYQYTDAPSLAKIKPVNSRDRKETELAKKFTYDDIYSRDSVARTDREIEDFRKITNSELKVDYETDSIHKAYGVSNPGAKHPSLKKDSITTADIGEDYDSAADPIRKDLIKFRFESAEYSNTPGQPLDYVPLLFRAYLTNFQDSHTGDYSPFRYTGRGENFYTYNGFTRTLSFGFKAAVQSEQEMKPLYRKLNYFISQVYPDFNDTGFMRTPLARITIGDYLVLQPGFFTSITISVSNDSPWEIYESEELYQLPHILDISCQFTPIHNFIPRRGFKTNSPVTDQNKSSYFIPPLITTAQNNKYDINKL